MTTQSTVHKIKCPHPECQGLLSVRDNMPSGEYQCICHGCTVKLSWATYLQEGRKPYLTLVTKGEVSK